MEAELRGSIQSHPKRPTERRPRPATPRTPGRPPGPPPPRARTRHSAGAPRSSWRTPKPWVPEQLGDGTGGKLAQASREEDVFNVGWLGNGSGYKVFFIVFRCAVDGRHSDKFKR